MMLIYDGGVMADPSAIRLPADELRSYRFIPASELERYVNERFAFRIRQALCAREQGCPVEIINGMATM